MKTKRGWRKKEREGKKVKKGGIRGGDYKGDENVLLECS